MIGLQLQTVLAAGRADGEDTIWIQILVLIILAVSWGIYSLVKKKPSVFKDQQTDQATYTVGTGRARQSHSAVLHKNLFQKQQSDIQNKPVYNPEVSKIPEPVPATEEKIAREIPKRKPDQRDKDLLSGMELLEMDFLLSIVENTKDDNESDVVMHKLIFDELLRRKQLNVVDSKVLKNYAIKNVVSYDKYIRLEAMKELAKRTTNKNMPSS